MSKRNRNYKKSRNYMKYKYNKLIDISVPTNILGGYYIRFSEQQKRILEEQAEKIRWYLKNGVLPEDDGIIAQREIELW